MSLRLRACVTHSLLASALPAGSLPSCWPTRASSPWEEGCPHPEFPNPSGTLHCRRGSRIDRARDSRERWRDPGPALRAGWRSDPGPGESSVFLFTLLLSRTTGITKPLLEARLLVSQERPRAWHRIPRSPPTATAPTTPGPAAPGARAGPLTLMIRSPSFTPAFTAAPPARGGSGQRGPPPVLRAPWVTAPLQRLLTPALRPRAAGPG